MPQMTLQGLVERTGKFVSIFVNDMPVMAEIRVENQIPFLATLGVERFEEPFRINLTPEDVAGIVEDESGNLSSNIRLDKVVPR
jgi:hypothetical protein